MGSQVPYNNVCSTTWTNKRHQSHMLYSNLTKSLQDLIHTETLHNYYIKKSKIQLFQEPHVDWQARH